MIGARGIRTGGNGDAYQVRAEVPVVFHLADEPPSSQLVVENYRIASIGARTHSTQSGEYGVDWCRRRRAQQGLRVALLVEHFEFGIHNLHDLCRSNGEIGVRW